MVPYVLFWLVSMIPYRELYSFWMTKTFVPLTRDEILGLVLGGHWLADHSNIFVLWYLQLYFIAYFPFELIVRTRRKSIMILACLVIGAVTVPFQRLLPGRPVFHINVLPAAVVFMLLGYLFSYLLDTYEIICQAKKNMAIGGLLVVVGAGISARHFGSIADVISWLYYVGAALTIVGYYILSSRFENKRAVQIIGENTLYIMWLHWLTLDWAQRMSAAIMQGVGLVSPFIQNVLCVLVSLTICCGLIEAWRLSLVPVRKILAGISKRSDRQEKIAG